MSRSSFKHEDYSRHVARYGASLTQNAKKAIAAVFRAWDKVAAYQGSNLNPHPARTYEHLAKLARDREAALLMLVCRKGGGQDDVSRVGRLVRVALDVRENASAFERAVELVCRDMLSIEGRGRARTHKAGKELDEEFREALRGD